jgi:hypothetical protein
VTDFRGGYPEANLPYTEVTVSAVSPFAGTITLRKVAGVVFCYNTGISRATSFSSSFTLATAAGAIPAAYRPASNETLPAGTIWATAVGFQAAITSTGEVSIRMTAANAGTMPINAQWPAA